VLDKKKETENAVKDDDIPRAVDILVMSLAKSLNFWSLT